MQADEWLKLALVVAVPLAIAAVVTLWSIKQMAYRPKNWTAPQRGRIEQSDAALATADGTGGHRERAATGSVATPPGESRPTV